MEYFFNQFGIWLGIATAVIIGIVAIYGLFDTKFRERRKVVDGTEDRIISLLQTEVTELTKRVDHQAKELLKLQQEINKITSENEILVKVLQGRDDRTEQFYEQLAEFVLVNKETNKNVESLVIDVRSLVGAIKSN